MSRWGDVYPSGVSGRCLKNRGGLTPRARAALDNPPSIHYQNQIRREKLLPELSNQLVVVCVRTNPIPDDVILVTDTNSAII